MDPCVKLCTDLGAVYGVEVIKLASMVAGFVFLLWRNRKTDQKATSADERAAIATEQAAKAKTELRETKLSLARIEGSMRPAAIVMPDVKVTVTEPDPSVPDLTLHGVKLPPVPPVPKESEL